ncbi:MAG: hypothetical protein DI535_11490 [Citrobacter freundii]|nr:MAG: hypothetical protein DI535_11490 [Citrobacter freundii]
MTVTKKFLCCKDRSDSQVNTREKHKISAENNDSYMVKKRRVREGEQTGNLKSGEELQHTCCIDRTKKSP